MPSPGSPGDGTLSASDALSAGGDRRAPAQCCTERTRELGLGGWMRRRGAPGYEPVRPDEHGTLGACPVERLEPAARVDHVVPDAVGVDGNAECARRRPSPDAPALPARSGEDD